MKLAKAVDMAQLLLVDKLRDAACVVDATAGNGKDTLFLAANSKAQTVVWTFDIQEVAIHNTKKLITLHGYQHKARFVLDSHANIDNYVDTAIDIAMFNLGYLPGGQRHITTQPDSTVIAVKKILEKLIAGGLLSLVVYPGHPAGRAEYETLKGYLSDLPQQFFSVSCWQTVNQINNPPLLYIIEKR